jgi:hypothetical protein
MYMYIDNTQVATSASTAIYNGTADFLFGVHGEITFDEVAVWSRVITSQERADLSALASDEYFSISGTLKERESDVSGEAYDYLIINRATSAVVASGTAESDGTYSEEVADGTTEHDIIMIDPAGTYNPKVIGEKVTGV